MPNGLPYFFAKYGPDFLKKLPLYATAKRGNEYVRLLLVNVEKMMVEVRDAKGNRSLCKVEELDDFVL